MNNTLKGILTICGLLVMLLIFGILLNYSESPENTYSVSEPVIINEKPKTESLWILTKANIRNGPGKEFEVVTTLTMLEEIMVIKDDTSQWKEVIDPVQGYIFHTLIGDKDAMRLSYVAYIDKAIKIYKQYGIIIKADGWNIYVNRYKWIQLGEKSTWAFVERYAYAFQIKNDMESVICYVYDYQTGGKILYYNTEYDMFKRY